MQPTFQQRLLALTPRERLFLGVGALSLLLFVLFFLLPDSEAPLADAEGVEIAEAPPPTAPATAPPTLQPSYVPPPPAVTQPAAAGSGGLVLKSILATAAIFTLPGGGERRILLGREVAPGLTLKAVGVQHAILGGAGGDMRVELGRAGATPVEAAAPAPSVTAEAGGATDPRREALKYRLAMDPVSRGGRITGYALKPGANLPELARAGLKPGDIIVRVNGSGFNEERLMELSWELENASAVEFEVIRDGRPVKLVLNKNNTR